MIDAAKAEGLVEMKARVEALEKAISRNPFGSTALQLRRYVNWWRQDQSFSRGRPISPAKPGVSRILCEALLGGWRF